MLSAAVFFLGLSLAEAQQTPKTPRIGILISESQHPESQVIRGLRDGLKELGYREKKNILIEIHNAKGDRGALKPMASEIVSQKVNVIVTTRTRATQMAQAATSEIPIVFSHPANPVALGLVNSMERPGKNTTGVAGLSLQMTEQRLQVFKEIVPNLRRVHIFYDSNNKFSQENFVVAQKAAAKLGFEVAAHSIKSVDELKSSISRIEKSAGDALFHVPDDLVEAQADFIFDIARKKGLPTMFNEEVWVIKGALAAYGPSYYQMGHQAAQLVDKILKGEKPQNLPVERVKKFELVINFRTAKIMGLTIPPEVLKRADKVIR